jgi:hypothetical protein
MEAYAQIRPVGVQIHTTLTVIIAGPAQVLVPVLVIIGIVIVYFTPAVLTSGVYIMIAIITIIIPFVVCQGIISFDSFTATGTSSVLFHKTVFAHGFIIKPVHLIIVEPFFTVAALEIIFFTTIAAYRTIILALNEIILVGILSAAFTQLHEGKV